MKTINVSGKNDCGIADLLTHPTTVTSFLQIRNLRLQISSWGYFCFPDLGWPQHHRYLGVSDSGDAIPMAKRDESKRGGVYHLRRDDRQSGEMPGAIVSKR